MTRIDPPQSGFGECKIIYQAGEILDVTKSERVRVKKNQAN
jgi:hypothetical protein